MSSPPISGKKPSKPSKPSILGRLAKKFEAEPNPQFVRSSVRETRISTQAAIQEEREAASAVGEEAENGVSPEAAAKDQHRSLWSRAADELGDESKYVRAESYTLHFQCIFEHCSRTELC